MNDRHMEVHNDGNATDEGFTMKQRRQSLRDKTCGLVGIGLSSVSSLGNGDFCHHWFLVAIDLRLDRFCSFDSKITSCIDSRERTRNTSYPPLRPHLLVTGPADKNYRKRRSITSRCKSLRDLMLR